MQYTLLTRLFLGAWLAWGILWIALARWSAPVRSKESLLRRLRHGIFLVVGGALTFVAAPRDTLLGRPLFPVPSSLAWAGFALTVAGMAHTVWARVTLGRMWSGRITLKEDHQLVERGPYAITRHPIYTGLLFALLGSSVARGSVASLLGFLIISIGFILKLGQEEELLMAHFGSVYAEYRGRVKGLIPFVW